MLMGRVTGMGLLAFSNQENWSAYGMKSSLDNLMGAPQANQLS